jgi:hypothetical protein
VLCTYKVGAYHWSHRDLKLNIISVYLMHVHYKNAHCHCYAHYENKQGFNTLTLSDGTVGETL